jgi:hypothetical protein
LLTDRDADQASVPGAGHGTGVVGWQPIETAPKDGTLVIAFYADRHGHGRYSLRYWAAGDWGARSEGWSDQHRQLRSSDPTHWMPLPPPPAASVSMGTSGASEPIPPVEGVNAELLEAAVEMQAARHAQWIDPNMTNADRVNAADDALDAAIAKATALEGGQ